MNTFHERKQERAERYFKYVYGWKQRKCCACNGSGYYDHSFGGKTPRCSSCRGSGKERYKPEVTEKVQ